MTTYTNKYACLESVQKSNKPLSWLSITPLVIRNDATPLWCYAWCERAVTWSFSWGKRCRGGSAPCRDTHTKRVVDSSAVGCCVWAYGSVSLETRNKPQFMPGQRGVRRGQWNRICQILQKCVVTAGLYLKGRKVILCDVRQNMLRAESKKNKKTTQLRKEKFSCLKHQAKFSLSLTHSNNFPTLQPIIASLQ